MPLKTGTCEVCKTEKVKLRPNPFSKDEECEECRTSGPKAIIGITDIKKEYKLKDSDVEGLETVKEAKPAFVGGPDYRFYLKSEVEKRAAEVEKIREQEAKDKEAENKTKAAEKEKKLAEKEEEKKAKLAEKEKKAAEKEAEKERKAAEKKRKREEKDEANPKAKRVPREKKVATRAAPRRAAASKKSLAEDEGDDEEWEALAKMDLKMMEEKVIDPDDLDAALDFCFAPVNLWFCLVFGVYSKIIFRLATQSNFC